MSLPNGGVRVTHREYCSSINKFVSTAESLGSGNMLVDAVPLQLPINPGDGSTFPWLTGIATRYQKYHFRSLKFSYVPTCSTLTQGGVIMAPIYDPAEPVPTTRQELMNNANSQSGTVRNNLTMNIPTSSLGKEPLFVREFHHTLNDPAERRTTDLGYLAIMLTDTNDGQHFFGDLFVTYTVDLMEPRLGGTGAKVLHLKTNPTVRTSGPRYMPLIDESSLNSAVNRDSTLAVRLENETRGDWIHSTNTTAKVDYTALIFEEPFTGLVTFVSDNTGAASLDNPEVTVNGMELHTGLESSQWVLEADFPIEGVARHRFAKVKPFHSIKNGVKSAIHTISVIANKGESLAMALGNIIDIAEHTVEIIITEVGPIVLDVAAGLVL